MIKKEYTYAGIIIALILGIAVGWAIRGPGAEVPEAKFPGPDVPPAGTKIIHGMDAAYPPFTKIDATGKAVGFDVDVVDWIAAKYGWEVEHKPWEWAGIVTAVLEGDLDFVASGMTHNPGRAEVVWFTIPYYTYIHQLITLAEETRTREQILNSGEMISCQKGATSEEWVEKLLEQGFNFEKLALDSYELAFEAVLDGRAVAAISDSAFTGPYFREDPAVGAKFKIVSTIGPYFTYAYATRPEDYGLRDALNHALEEIMSSPYWNELKEKWDV